MNVIPSNFANSRKLIPLFNDLKMCFFRLGDINNFLLSESLAQALLHHRLALCREIPNERAILDIVQHLLYNT